VNPEIPEIKDASTSNTLEGQTLLVDPVSASETGSWAFFIHSVSGGLLVLA
jgi:hypothetical protein